MRDILPPLLRLQHRDAQRYSPLKQVNKQTVKRLVPVWKKEFFADGEVWVDGEWDESVVKARA